MPKRGLAMPKLFPIHIEVEELAVGKVMRQLHNTPGVAKVNLDLGTPKLNGAERGPRGPYAPRKQSVQLDETGDQAVAKSLFGKPPMTTSQLRDVFLAQGRSAKSINSVLHKMKHDGEVQSSDGHWSLTKLMRDRMRHRKAKRK
jgi:hypothetical protein